MRVGRDLSLPGSIRCRARAREGQDPPLQTGGERQAGGGMRACRPTVGCRAGCPTPPGRLLRLILFNFKAAPDGGAGLGQVGKIAAVDELHHQVAQRCAPRWGLQTRSGRWRWRSAGSGSRPGCRRRRCSGLCRSCRSGFARSPRRGGSPVRGVVDALHDLAGGGGHGLVRVGAGGPDFFDHGGRR